MSVFGFFTMMENLSFYYYFQGLEVQDVGDDVFIVFSDAIASMPGSFLWAILFFFMLITLCIDRFVDDY